MSLAHTFIYLILISQSSSLSQIFNCTGRYACVWQNITCNNNENCTIICAGEGSCEWATINCPSSSNPSIQNKCNIVCNGSWSCSRGTINGGIHSESYINASQYEALRETSILAMTSSKLTLICMPYSCIFSTVQCPSSSNSLIPSQCNISCHGDYACYSNSFNGGNNSELYITASGSSVLTHSNISAINSSKLTLIGDEQYYVFSDLKIICPSSSLESPSACNLRYNASHSRYYDFYRIWISSPSSFNGINMTYTQFSTGVYYNARMYCTNASNPWHETYCNMTTTNGYEWNCADSSSKCYITTKSDTSGLTFAVIISVVSCSLLFVIMAFLLLYRCRNRNRMNNNKLNREVPNYYSINLASTTSVQMGKSSK